MNEGLTAADIAAVTGGRGGMFGGDGGDWGAWIILFLLFGLFGRGGYGGFGGGGGCGEGCATQADVRAAVDQQTLISKLDQQTYGLADSTYALNNAISTGFHGVDNGFATMSAQLAKCCCDIERGIDGVNYNMAQNTCTLQNTMNNNTRDIIDNANSNTRAILDFLTKDKIDTLTAENQALRFQASQSAQSAFITANQEAQTAELIRRIAPAPVPAYTVPAPYPYGCGCGTGWNNGCGC